VHRPLNWIKYQETEVVPQTPLSASIGFPSGERDAFWTENKKMAIDDAAQ
jgi:hypothetical protein